MSWAARPGNWHPCQRCSWTASGEIFIERKRRLVTRTTGPYLGEATDRTPLTKPSTVSRCQEKCAPTSSTDTSRGLSFETESSTLGRFAASNVVSASKPAGTLLSRSSSLASHRYQWASAPECWDSEPPARSRDRPVDVAPPDCLQILRPLLSIELCVQHFNCAGPRYSLLSQTYLPPP